MCTQDDEKYMVRKTGQKAEGVPEQAWEVALFCHAVRRVLLIQWHSGRFLKEGREQAMPRSGRRQVPGVRGQPACTLHRWALLGDGR